MNTSRKEDASFEENEKMEGMSDRKAKVIAYSCGVVWVVCFFIAFYTGYNEFYPMLYNILSLKPDVESRLISLSGGLHIYDAYIFILLSVGVCSWLYYKLKTDCGSLCRKPKADIKVFSLFFLFGIVMVRLAYSAVYLILFSINTMTLGETQVYITVIDDKKGYGRGGNHLIVRIDDLQQCSLNANQRAFDRSQVGDTVYVHLRKGMIGIPYIDEFDIKYSSEE